MNQRVPDSSGLPLRAMVMVLLFLGIIFLLLGINAVRSGKGSSNQATPVVTTTATTTTSSPTAAPKADVHVYNISGVEGAAARVRDRLTATNLNIIVEQGTRELPDVTATSVFYTDAPGERETAEEVAKALDNAPVELRRPEMADWPPGVIVTVTG